MSAFNRYKFLKHFNKDKIVLLATKDRYISYGYDINILEYVDFNCSYKYSNLIYFDKYEINYIVLDNLDIIDVKEYKNNNYDKYLKLYYLDKIINKCGNNLKKLL